MVAVLPMLAGLLGLLVLTALLMTAIVVRVVLDLILTSDQMRDDEGAQ